MAERIQHGAVRAPTRSPRGQGPCEPVRQASRDAFPPITALRALDAVARHGGLRKAAAALSVDHSAISRHLRALEAWTGARLITKTGRNVTLTADGSRYRERLAPALDAIADATAEVTRRRKHRRFSIWATPSLAHWLSTRLPSFRGVASDLDLEIELRPSETAPNLAYGEADVDLHYFPTGVPIRAALHIRQETLCAVTSSPVASPEYLRGSPPIREAGDVLKHTLIHDRSVEGWRSWLSVNGVPNSEPIGGGPRLWQAHLILDAARRGEGIALASDFEAGDDIEAGRLVKVAGSAVPFNRSMWGHYVFMSQESVWNSPAVSAFRYWLKAAVSASVEQPDDLARQTQGPADYPRVTPLAAGWPKVSRPTDGPARQQVVLSDSGPGQTI